MGMAEGWVGLVGLNKGALDAIHPVAVDWSRQRQSRSQGVMENNLALDQHLFRTSRIAAKGLDARQACPANLAP